MEEIDMALPESIAPEVIIDQESQLNITATSIVETAYCLENLEDLTNSTSNESRSTPDVHKAIENEAIIINPCDDIKILEDKNKSVKDNTEEDGKVFEEFEIMISPPASDLVESPALIMAPLVNDKSLNKIKVDSEKNISEEFRMHSNSELLEHKTAPLVETCHRKASVEIYPRDLNPFGDEGSQEEDVQEAVSNSNPFGSSDEDEEPTAQPVPSGLHGKSELPPQPTSRSRFTLNVKKVSEESFPKTSGNPFWSDGEEPISDNDSKHKTAPTSLSSTLRRKKKPAPPPPVADSASLLVPSSSNSTTSSPRPRNRKARPAPPPPSVEHPFLQI